MKILHLDIETAPATAAIWGIWKENIGINQLLSAGYVMCWSAKWHGEPASSIRFDSVMKSSPKAMLGGIHRLLGESDAVVHYYGSSFDIPTLNKEFVTHGMRPPAPYKQIDLCDVVKRKFKFISAKLDYVASHLGLGEKVRHPGFELWAKCMARDVEAWKLMEKYNKQDVLLTEKLYNRLLPWIDGHPSHATIGGYPCCPNCGSEKVKRSGFAYTAQFKYQRFECLDCGKWYRSNSSETRQKVRVTGLAS